MKNQLLKSLLFIALILPAIGLAENNSISLRDLFKKITKTPETESSTNATPADDVNLGVNGFKSRDEALSLLQSLGWFKDGVIDVIESPAFEGFYTLISKSSAGWLPHGILFSKTDNIVIGSDSAFRNEHEHKAILYEVANKKLIPSTQNYEAFVKSRLLPKLNNELFIKITQKSIDPKAYVISAADCPYCRKLEKGLYKAKVSHYVLPDFSMINADMKLAQKNNIAIVCGGEKPWIDKMVNNVPFKSLEICEDKVHYYMAQEEVSNVLRSAGLMSGFPTTILVNGNDSAVIGGYCDALPKLINNNNTGKTVNLSDCKKS